MNKKLKPTQIAKDSEGNLIGVESLTAEAHKGSKRGKGSQFYHIVTNEPITPCALNSKKVQAYFRKFPSESTGGKRGESYLLNLLKAIIPNCLTSLDIDGFKSELTDFKENPSFYIADKDKQKIENTGVRADFECSQCIIRIAITNEMHDEKALLFESLNIPLIEIRFCVDEKEEVYQQYQEMTLEDISKDLQSRSKLRKPLREYIEEPYKKMLKQAQDECIKVESEGKQREKELLKLNEQLKKELTALRRMSNQENRRAFKRTGRISCTYNNSNLIIFNSEIFHIHSRASHLRPIFKDLERTQIQVTLYFVEEEDGNKVYAIS
jgi:hypothetical protein